MTATFTFPTETGCMQHPGLSLPVGCTNENFEEQKSHNAASDWYQVNGWFTYCYVTGLHYMPLLCNWLLEPDCVNWLLEKLWSWRCESSDCNDLLTDASQFSGLFWHYLCALGASHHVVRESALIALTLPHAYLSGSRQDTHPNGGLNTEDQATSQW